MAPKYTLTYFKARGRAELVRLLLAYGAIEYEDVRHELGADSALYKSKAPFGQLPILEVDGKAFSQSLAIGRYLARELGLEGKTSLEKLEVDMIVDTLEDMAAHLIRWHLEEDPAKKEKMLHKCMDETLPHFLSKFDEIIAKNGGFTVGKELTYGDFALACKVFEMCNASFLKPFDFKKYPNVIALKEKVHDLPGVKEYVQRRPETPF